MASEYSEAQLEAIRRNRNADDIPLLVDLVARQQHDLDALRLKVEVAQRDREELRAALLQAQQRIRSAAEQ